MESILTRKASQKFQAGSASGVSQMPGITFPRALGFVSLGRFQFSSQNDVSVFALMTVWWGNEDYLLRF